MRFIFLFVAVVVVIRLLAFIVAGIFEEEGCKVGGCVVNGM